MRNLHIIMPMAGEGRRFQGKEYNMPKPLIQSNGLPLFIRAISSLDDINASKSYTFIVRQKHIRDYDIDKIIRSYIPEAHIAFVEHTTRGAVETALFAKPYISEMKEFC